MADSDSVVDEIIRNAMKGGGFSDLPGAGKPLQIDDDPNVPPHLRMAHKLMRDNDIRPAWVLESKEIDALRARALTALRRSARAYRAGSPIGSVESAWQSTQRAFENAATAYNRKVLSYNLKVPPGVVHKLHLDVPREIARALAGE